MYMEYTESEFACGNIRNYLLSRVSGVLHPQRVLREACFGWHGQHLFKEMASDMDALTEQIMVYPEVGRESTA